MSIRDDEFSMLQHVFQQSANSCATMAHPFLHSPIHQKDSPKFSFRIPYFLFWVPIGIRLDSIGIHNIIHRYSGFIQYDFHLTTNNRTKIAKTPSPTKSTSETLKPPDISIIERRATHQHLIDQNTIWPPGCVVAKRHGRVYLRPGMPWPQSIVWPPKPKQCNQMCNLPLLSILLLCVSSSMYFLPSPPAFKLYIYSHHQHIALQHLQSDLVGGFNPSEKY